MKHFSRLSSESKNLDENLPRALPPHPGEQSYARGCAKPPPSGISSSHPNPVKGVALLLLSIPTESAQSNIVLHRLRSHFRSRFHLFAIRARSPNLIIRTSGSSSLAFSSRHGRPEPSTNPSVTLSHTHTRTEPIHQMLPWSRALSIHVARIQSYSLKFTQTYTHRWVSVRMARPETQCV